MLACIIIKTILTVIIDSIELLFIWGFCIVTVTVLIYGLSYLSELGFQKMPVRHIQIEAIDDLDEVEADDPENPDPVNDLDPHPHPHPLRLAPPPPRVQGGPATHRPRGPPHTGQAGPTEDPCHCH